MASPKKLLSCAFLPDVLCSFRKTEQLAILEQCLKCEHYARFMHEMDEEDEATDAFCEWAHKNPEAYLRGEHP